MEAVKNIIRKPYVLIPLITVLVIVLGWVIWSVATPMPADLPNRQPLPDYLLEANPGPGDAPLVRLNGEVCVVFHAQAVLEPGDYWDYEDIEELSGFTLDGKERTLKRVVHSYKVYSLVDPNDPFMQPTAKSFGPNTLCWAGSWQPGYHVATFTFSDRYSYTWWYKVGF